MLPSGRCAEPLRSVKQNKDINITREPYTEVFGLTFLVEDPDGHIIRVCPLD